MTTRDELIADLESSDQLGCGCCSDSREVSTGPEEWDVDYTPRVTALADDLLAAGWRKSKTVTTAAELDALPVGSVVLDAQGWVCVILPTIDGQRCVRVAKSGDNLWALNSLVVQQMLPATVLHEGATK